MKLTHLSYALIGLLSIEKKSGYALRRMFETTPIGAFSSSPGSIYPALNKLDKLKLIEKTSTTGKNKNVYSITELGNDALYTWLTQEVSLEEMEKSPSLIILRFSFLESVNKPKLTLTFLTSFKQVLSKHLSNLKSFMSSEEGLALSVYGKLSMESGIKQYEAYWSWVNNAIETFEKSQQHEVKE